MAERPRELGDFKKARLNGGTDNHSLKGFSQAIDGMRTLPLSALKGGSKSDFFVFELKSTADHLKRCQLSSPVNAINI